MKTQNRKEIFLKALANGEEANIKPLTREEMLLKKQAERESAGGGGGASGGGGAFAVNFETTDGQNWTCDKTYEEINTAFENGKTIKGVIKAGGIIVNIECCGKTMEGDLIFRNYSYVEGVGINFMFFFIGSNDECTFKSQLIQMSGE